MVHPDEPINPDKEFGNSGTSGLTKREYFAGMAMQGMLANSEIIKIMTKAKVNPNKQAEFLSVAAVEQGDSIIEELNKVK